MLALLRKDEGGGIVQSGEQKASGEISLSPSSTSREATKKTEQGFW